MRQNWIVGCVIAAAALSALPRPAAAYIEKAYTLGEIVTESTNVVLARVESVDRNSNVIVLKKVADLKGVQSVEYIRENIAHAGFRPQEWQNVMAWAAEGKLAVVCRNESASETCIDNYWFQSYARKGAPEWWDMYHAEPYLLRSFAGKSSVMAEAVKAMLKGQEPIVPAMVDGDKNALVLRTARTEQLRVGMKLLDYNEARDFAGWGSEDIRPVLDMAGFQQISTLPRIDGGGNGWGIAAGHLDSPDKTDLVLWSEQRVAILANQGEGSFDEVGLPGDKDHFGGARAAALADYNATGRGSVLLATPAGPRLLTNLGAGKFRDDSAALPQRPYWSLTAAAWVSVGDPQRPAIVLADEFAGLRLVQNESPTPKIPGAQPAAAAAAAPAGPPPENAIFKDISGAAGLGEKGLAAGMPVLELLAADLMGDGSQCLIVNSADGRVMVLGMKNGKFTEITGTGLSWAPGSRLAVGDIDGDGKPDLIAAGPAGIRIFKSDGNCRFHDVTQSAGLGSVAGTSAVFVPRFEAGKNTLDLLVGCLRGPNRFFRNNGRGAFVEATHDVGLDRRIFNSRALAVIPADKGREGSADLVMLNEGQPSAVLIWKK